MTYQEIKTKLQDPENKKMVIIGAAFVVVFLAGFGTGKFQKLGKPADRKTQVNYTTKKDEKPVAQPVGNAPETAGQGTVAAVAGTTTPNTEQNCIVKGNIASGSRKIYHVKGGASYKTVKPEQCFATEAEAVAAGFVKAQR